MDVQAFRAVLSQQKKQGFMDTVKLIPILRNLPITQLQRICELSTEETFKKGQVIASVQSPPLWTFAVVLSGKVKLKSHHKEDGTGKSKKRAENSFILAAEIQELQVSVVADADGTKLALIPKLGFDEVLGEEGRRLIETEMHSPRGAQNRILLTRTKSIFSTDNKLMLNKLSSKNDYTLDAPIIVYGDFAYIASFKKRSTSSQCSMKVISKKRAAENKMDHRLLEERKFLAAMSDLCPTLANISALYQDAKVLMLEYSDVFVCDLSMAIVNAALTTTEMKVFYGASVYSAMKALHAHGLMHRFINSGSVLITDSGIPKVRSQLY